MHTHADILIVVAEGAAILLVFALCALMPFFFLLISSFKPGQEMIRNGLQFIFDFENYSLVNYGLLWTDRDGLYLRWYLNSAVILVAQVGFGLFFASFVGYGLAKYSFRGRNLLFILVLMVMMIPVEILILPLYKEMNSFGLINKYMGVVLPIMIIFAMNQKAFIAGLTAGSVKG